MLYKETPFNNSLWYTCVHVPNCVLFAGARKWIASLDFDADSFKAAIVNIYPRLASVPSYTLWNVKSDKTFEKLPSTVNTPKRIKAYLGPTFTGSLVIMPSEEISLVSLLAQGI